MSDADKVAEENYIKDPRIPCKYGIKCYQKNTEHHSRYKHPPKAQNNENVKHARKKMKIGTNDGTKQVIVKNDLSDSDDNNSDDFVNEFNSVKTNFSNDVSDSDDENETKVESVKNYNTNVSDDVSDLSISHKESGSDSLKNQIDYKNTSTTENKIIPEIHHSSPSQEILCDFNPKKFIKEQFLVDMPHDFYHFWDLCKNLKKNNPLEALNEVGLTLVGPYDVLAGKFSNVNKSAEEYLVHWRYYHDPPELQTVLKGNINTGYHIGYFRDSPQDTPVFLTSNSAKKDGVLKQMGGNIFAAVNIYLEELKKSGNPFQKIQIGRIQTTLKNEADKLKIDLSQKTEAMISREKKIVTRTFNKVGLVVPYNRKTQQGYRELALGDKDLLTLLNKLHTCLPEQKRKYLSELQPVFTYASIAADECDFGTGIELGWDIISHETEDLNNMASEFLATNYRLLNKEVFAKIAEVHMKKRKKGCDLSIV